MSAICAAIHAEILLRWRPALARVTRHDNCQFDGKISKILDVFSALFARIAKVKLTDAKRRVDSKRWKLMTRIFLQLSGEGKVGMVKLIRAQQRGEKLNP